MSTSINPNSFMRDVPETARQIIITAVMNGNLLRNAAKLAHVSYTKLRAYTKWAEQTLADPDYHPDDYSAAELAIIDFAQSLAHKEAHREQELLFRVQAAADTDWKAAVHLLKIMNPDDWSEKGSNTSSNAQNNASQGLMEGSALSSMAAGGRLDLSKLETEELLLLEKLLAKARPDDALVARRQPEGADRIVMGTTHKPKSL